MQSATITILPYRVVDDDDALDMSRHHDRVAVKGLMKDHWPFGEGAQGAGQSMAVQDRIDPA
jgi:hypothetical protein